MWSDAKDLPTYSPIAQEEVRTSVMHPLRKEGRAMGVVEFATQKYVEPTPASLEELQMLAKVISRAYQMYDVQRDQRDNTMRAMKKLEKALENEHWTRLALPQLFVAYASVERLEKEAQADHEAIINTIRHVVGKFADVLNPVFWEDKNEPGDITNDLIREIADSDFGLCYFSEPTPQGQGQEQFQDNANVLFEAGMMQAYANTPNAPLKAWIAVREKASSSIPFDIASHRTLYVRRGDNGKLEQEPFAKELQQRVDALFEEVQTATTNG